MTMGFVPKDGSVPATVIAVPIAEMHGREDKGLPDAKSLRDLARTYLEIQTRCWGGALHVEICNCSGRIIANTQLRNQ